MIGVLTDGASRPAPATDEGAFTRSSGDPATRVGRTTRSAAKFYQSAQEGIDGLRELVGARRRPGRAT